MQTFLIFSAVLAAFAVVAANYCDMSCVDYFNNNAIIPHIGCNHNGKFNKTACPSDAKIVPMTDDVRKTILHLHNVERDITAGGGHTHLYPACKMPVMKWDHELEKLAILNVRQCGMKHDKCHNTKRFSWSGQNLAEGYSYPKALNVQQIFKSSVNGWVYKEVQFTNPDIMQSYPRSYSGPQIGHFTVMMSDRNTHVGCAAATYTKNGLHFYLSACNYAYNNMLGERIYAACQESGCKNTGSGYENLCP